MIIYGFMIFASMPAFFSDDTGITKGLTITNFLWVLMIFFIYVPKLVTHKLQLTGFEKNIFLLIIIIFISILRGWMIYDFPFYQTWFYSFLKPLQYIILYIVISNYFHTEKDVKSILIVIVLISATLSIILLWNYNQGLNELTASEGFMSARTGALTNNPYSLTLGFIFSLLILIFLFMESRILKEKIFFIIVAIVILLGILFSYTRASWIFGPIGVIVYMLLINQRKKARNILFVLLTFGTIIIFAPDNIKTRALTLGFLNKHTSIISQSESVRMEFAISGLRYLSNNPKKIFIGGGLGDFEQNAYKYSDNELHKKGRDAHNTLVSYLCQVGLVGLAIIGLIYFKIFSFSQRLRRIGKNRFAKNFGALLISQMIVYFLYSFISTSLLMWDVGFECIIFGSLFGCAFILRRNFVVKTP